MIAIRYADDRAMMACPHCGRFVGTDPDGYYDASDPKQPADMQPVAAFCDEKCACLHHNRPVPVNYWKPTR